MKVFCIIILSLISFSAYSDITSKKYNTLVNDYNELLRETKSNNQAYYKLNDKYNKLINDYNSKAEEYKKKLSDQEGKLSYETDTHTDELCEVFIEQRITLEMDFNYFITNGDLTKKTFPTTTKYALSELIYFEDTITRFDERISQIKEFSSSVGNKCGRDLYSKDNLQFIDTYQDTKTKKLIKNKREMIRKELFKSIENKTGKNQ